MVDPEIRRAAHLLAVASIEIPGSTFGLDPSHMPALLSALTELLGAVTDELAGATNRSHREVLDDAWLRVEAAGG